MVSKARSCKLELFLHKTVPGVGELVQGLIPGGVAIVWNINDDPAVNTVRLIVEWGSGMEINCSIRKCNIFNIYMAFVAYQKEDELLASK